MKCVICRGEEVGFGKATVTLERDGVTLVVKDVPAHVCANCGEEYVNENVAASLLTQADQAVKNGVQVDIRRYSAA